MHCTNTYCYWHYNGSCCHESEDAYDKATPDELDCPASLRSDFEEQLFNLLDECTELLNKRNMKELREIKKFILSQRQ